MPKPEPSSEHERELLADYRRKRQSLRPPAKLGDVVAQLLAKKGYGQIQAAAQLEAQWQTVAGARFAPHTKAGAVKRGVLEVFVANSVVLMELAMHKQPLLAALQKLAPQHQIRDLKFRVGGV